MTDYIDPWGERWSVRINARGFVTGFTVRPTLELRRGFFDVPADVAAMPRSQAPLDPARAAEILQQARAS